MRSLFFSAHKLEDLAMTAPRLPSQAVEAVLVGDGAAIAAVPSCAQGCMQRSFVCEHTHARLIVFMMAQLVEASRCVGASGIAGDHAVREE